MSYRGIGGGGFPYKKTESQRKFSMNAVPPPSNLNNSSRGRPIITHPTTSNSNEMKAPKHGFSTMNAIHFSNSSPYAVGSKRKTHTEDDYFDDEDTDLAYIPAPGSPSASNSSYYQKKSNNDEDEDEDDPLDAFMAGIEKQVEKEKKTAIIVPQTVAASTAGAGATVVPKSQIKGVRGDIDDEDDEESYYRYMEENPNAGVIDEGSEPEVDYDADGNPIAPPRKREIDPLPTIDHSEIVYETFEKNFYTPHEDITQLSRNKADELRKTLGMRVTGPLPPHPVCSFGHFGFDEALMKYIRKSEYTQPTPIQAQSIPAALGGRDLIGIAKTGSGKTAAFVWPMLVHIMDQRELSDGDGPIALILAPTRELSLQIYNEAKKFGKAYNINVVCCYGGGSKWEQSKALEEGAEVVVATPGRMIDMVKMKATNLLRVTYLVLDEADRMFNMGFEPQVRSICNHVRPDRQTLLFSATFKKRIEKLARDVLTDPIRIVQGDLGEANEDITQHVLIFNKPEQKWSWLLCKLVEFLSEGSILIFVTKKADAEQVANNLRLQERECVLLHGDMDQADRNKVITCFKRKECDVLVATDVAARGLDIPHIRTVVNYDIARDIDTHTHRIGRTGRAGEKGTAYTLVVEKDKEFAGHLVRNLEGANQEVPEALMELAMKSSWFRSSRFKGGKAKKINIGGAGLGYKERPGFGSTSRSTSGGGIATGGNPFRRDEDRSGVDKITASSSKAGPHGPDRYTAMKEAFKYQYQTQFKASSDRILQQKTADAGVFLAPSTPSISSSSSPKTTAKVTQNTEAVADDQKKPTKKSRWN